MKLYWSSRSPYVRKVMVTAHECGLADQIEREAIVVSAYLPNTDMLKKNPLGKIPTLILDDDSAVYDSRVICEYLDNQHDGSPLFPRTWPERLEALRFQATGDGMLDMLIMRLYEDRVRNDAQRSEELVGALQGKLSASLDSLDTAVATLQKLPFGIGHIAIGSALSYMDFRFADDNWRENRTALAQWHGTFRARPSVIATEHIDA
jgi:glutathione S-transferase